VRRFILLFVFTTLIDAQQKPSTWWVHASVVAHAMAAGQDGLSSWKQGELSPLYAEASGLQRGHFYRTGAARLTGVTLGIVAVSEVLGALKPKWRKYIGILNLAAAAAHVGVTTANVVRNPYYR
jgi:hypothetical protein